MVLVKKLNGKLKIITFPSTSGRRGADVPPHVSGPVSQVSATRWEEDAIAHPSWLRHSIRWRHWPLLFSLVAATCSSCPPSFWCVPNFVGVLLLLLLPPARPTSAMRRVKHWMETSNRQQTLRNKWFISRRLVRTLIVSPYIKKEYPPPPPFIKEAEIAFPERTNKMLRVLNKCAHMDNTWS